MPRCADKPAHRQKSNRAIAAETGVAFKTVARAASGVPNVVGASIETIWDNLGTPEKTIGLDGKSYPDGRPKIRIPNNWAPRDYQMNVWRYLERSGKRAICVWHRRAGKDDVCLHWAAASMIDKPATYWHMLPAFSQGRKAIWTAINPHTGKRRIDEAFPHELRVNTNESEMFIRFKNGSTWQVVGSDRYDAAVGSSPAGITFSEWALSDPSAWAYLAPIVTENDGWALFITTARGRNHAKSMLDMARTRDDWFSEVLPVNVTNAMSEAAVEQQRLEYTGIFGKEAADALIDQEYYCSFEAAILGAYWGKEMLLAEQQGRICDVPVNIGLPVHTAWDIGVDDAMAIWCFQVYPDHLDIVDYYEGHGLGFDHYCEWLDKRGYHGTDWYPHDVKVREAGSPGARTRIETLMLLGRKPELAPEQSLMDGINAGRKTIPFARFDAKRCAQGLEALRSYRTEWDEKARAFKKTPEHNWASHAADGWRCLSLSWRAPMRDPEEKKLPIGIPLPELTMDEFMDIEDGRSMREDRV
jgi:phage terminase large subunit